MNDDLKTFIIVIYYLMLILPCWILKKICSTQSNIYTRTDNVTELNYGKLDCLKYKNEHFRKWFPCLRVYKFCNVILLSIILDLCSKPLAVNINSSHVTQSLHYNRLLLPMHTDQTLMWRQFLRRISFHRSNVLFPMSRFIFHAY